MNLEEINKKLKQARWDYQMSSAAVNGELRHIFVHNHSAQSHHQLLKEKVQRLEKLREECYLELEG